MNFPVPTSSAEPECQLSGCTNPQKKGAEIGCSLPGFDETVYLKICAQHYAVVSDSQPWMYSIEPEFKLKANPAQQKE